jgi:carboxypeptidase Taq
MSTRHDDLYLQLCALHRETALLTSIDALLGWDERCLLPQRGGEHRAEQMTLLAGLVHERLVDPRIGDWLGELSTGPLAADPDSESAANLRQMQRNFDRRTKLPKSLVEELARTAVRGQQAWQEAREKNDYPLFRPLLEQMIHLKQQQAEALGYVETPYDALLDEFEPGERTANVRRVLAGLREQLVPLVAAIAESRRRADVSVLQRQFPIDVQQRFGTEAAKEIGFDFARGRLDVTSHPFCSGMGPHDVRLTTRYDERFFCTGFFGILHEAGHGLYEQGFDERHYGTPLAEAVSLGIHESQSRLWENLVGRNHAFWRHQYPRAQQAFPAALADVPLDTFYFAINDVRPSLIRVEADEATYNLHILIRFELEQALINGEVKLNDLPSVWNEKYQAALGIKSDTDADGVLQDIHWSAGLIGYFPTYSLGNLYAAQFFAQASQDLGNLDGMLARGEFAPLLDWLRQKIHRHGQRYTASRLVEQITGRPLEHGPLMAQLRSKFGPLYDL